MSEHSQKEQSGHEPRSKRRTDPLARKVRKLRKQVESRAFMRQSVERYVLAITLFVVLFFVVFLGVTLLADISCDICLIAAVAVAFLSISVWTALFLYEFIAARKYKRMRRIQKMRKYHRS